MLTRRPPVNFNVIFEKNDVFLANGFPGWSVHIAKAPFYKLKRL
jgi:hypothetical protein